MIRKKNSYLWYLLKNILLFIGILNNYNLFAQLKLGSYRIVQKIPNPKPIFFTHNISHFELNKDNSFDFFYGTSFSCRTFRYFSGNWKMKNDILFLIDTIEWQQDYVYFKEPIQTKNNYIILKVYNSKHIEMPNVEVQYIFNNKKDTLISYSGSNGVVKFEISDSERYNINKELKERESFVIVKFNDKKSKKEYSQVMFTYEPANFEVIIFESPKNIKVTRTNLYRFNVSKFNYLYTYFNDKNFRDLNYNIYYGAFENENK